MCFPKEPFEDAGNIVTLREVAVEGRRSWRRILSHSSVECTVFVYARLLQLG